MRLKYIKKFLEYHPDSGNFTHIRKRKSIRGIGKLAGAKQLNGYISIIICGRRYYAHRLAWWWVYGKFPKGNIDHINGDRSDNRIVNLRILNESHNGAWRHGLNKNNTSGFKGIFMVKRRYWQAKVKVMRRVIYVGNFKTKEAAARAYDIAAVRYFGPYASTNKSLGLL